MSITFEDIKRDALDVIQHHGIKGQKWGVRRTPQQLGHDEPQQTESKKAVEPKKKKVGYNSSKADFIRYADKNPLQPDMARDPKAYRKLSNDDFGKMLNRLKMEKEYDEIVNKDYNTVAAQKAKNKAYWQEQRNKIASDTIQTAIKWVLNTGGQLATNAINAEIQKKRVENKAAAGG